MEHVLVKYDSNWADEMDICGFCLMTKKAYEKWIKGWEELFKAIGGEFSFGVGSNEAIDYSSFKEFSGDLDVKEITDELYELLEIYFGKCYGIFPQDVPDIEDYS